MAFWRAVPLGVSVAVKVQPAARRAGILGTVPDAAGTRLKIAVTEPAEDGRANRAACAALAAGLDVPAGRRQRAAWRHRAAENPAGQRRFRRPRPPARRAVTARILDGKALAAAAARRASPPGSPACPTTPASPWCWSATIPPAPSMCATRTAPRSRPASPPDTIRLPADTDPGRPARRHRRPERRPGGGRHPGATAAAAAHRQPARCSRRSTRPRTSTASTPSMSAGCRRHGAAGALHAARRHEAAGRMPASRWPAPARWCSGRSAIVGKPVAAMLLAANATVTIAHSRTRDLAAECRRAEILVAAVGRPEMVRGDWIADGAAVIDVGINRAAGWPAGRRLRHRGVRRACRGRSRRCRAASGP